MARARALVAAVPQRVWTAVAGLVLLGSLGVSVVVGMGLSAWRGGVGDTPAGSTAPPRTTVLPAPGSAVIVVPGRPPVPHTASSTPGPSVPPAGPVAGVAAPAAPVAAPPAPPSVPTTVVPSPLPAPVPGAVAGVPSLQDLIDALAASGPQSPTTSRPLVAAGAPQAVAAVDVPPGQVRRSAAHAAHAARSSTAQAAAPNAAGTPQGQAQRAAAHAKAAAKHVTTTKSSRAKTDGHAAVHGGKSVPAHRGRHSGKAAHSGNGAHGHTASHGRAAKHGF